jgi:hypothetical protein
LLNKFKNKGISEPHEEFLKCLFLSLARLSFVKKLQQSIDSEFHSFLPDDKLLNDPTFKYCDESGDNPDA